MSNYFIYVGFAAAFILLFLLGTRIASIRAARNRRELYEASQARQQEGLPMPVTSGQVWTPRGFRPASEVYETTNGGIGTSGVAVTRMAAPTEGDNQLPSYGAPSIPIPESIYSPTTARYLPPSGAPTDNIASSTTAGHASRVYAPPEYKYEEPEMREGGGVGVTPPKYEGGGRS